MKRFFCFVALMLLGSPALAGESVSFVVGGHRIYVEAPRHCRSTSCVSVSIPGIYESRSGRGRFADDDDDAPDVKPTRPAVAPVPQPVSPPIAIAPAGNASAPPVASAPPPPAPALAASTIRPVVVPPPPAPAVQCNTPAAAPAAAPTAAPQVTPPPLPPLPPVVTAPKILNVSRDDEPGEAPVGDWTTEGNKGSVRIEPCGNVLCGYVLNAATNKVGETVLINMKPKAASQWSGNIFSRDSGNTYYATMTMKGTNSLRVEACAFGKFFCTGNLWSRIEAPSEKLITSRQQSSAPRS
jgi:uncharacterized protein (DUF2147 family)